MNPIKKTFEYGNHTVTIETGEIARQADGAVLVSMSDTVVLVTAVGRKEANPDARSFPLTVNYQEKYSAAGRIPGGFFKREGRPTEKETLTSRLIDRPIRPLFVDGYKNETQVIITVLSHDLENDSDVLAMVAASAALTISGLPYKIKVSAASMMDQTLGFVRFLDRYDSEVDSARVIDMRFANMIVQGSKRN